MHCLISSFASPILYLMCLVNLPDGSLILVSTTSQNKAIKAWQFKGLPSKQSISCSGAACCCRNYNTLDV